ncbi:hypothetical protein TNCV_1839841 [Trichonephila clavipes]|nr:hypothetical protein TNCV_1839841 [Trichonephila clavipes]
MLQSYGLRTLTMSEACRNLLRTGRSTELRDRDRRVLVAAVAEWYRYRIVAVLVTSSSPVPLKTRREIQQTSGILASINTIRKESHLLSFHGLAATHMVLIRDELSELEAPGGKRFESPGLKSRKTEIVKRFADFKF